MVDTGGHQTPGGSPPAPTEIILVPAHPVPGSSGVSLEVREGPGGANLLPVFSSVRRLVAAFGEAQPWLAMPLQRARELAAEGGVVEVLLDPAVLPGAWQWSFRDLETLERVLGEPQDDGRLWR